MQYLKKFGNVTTSNAPLEFVDGGWHSWDASNYFDVQTLTDSFDGQALKFTGATTSRYICKWETPGDSVTDCEVLARFKLGSSGWDQASIILRGSGDSSTERGYRIGINGSNWLSISTFQGNGTEAFNDNSSIGNVASGAWFWVRARVIDDGNSDPVVQGKCWRWNQDEEPDWMVEHTDTTATPYATSGWVGIYAESQDHYCDFISFTDDPENESAPYVVAYPMTNFGLETTSTAPDDLTSKWDTGNHTFLIESATNGIMQRSAAFAVSSANHYVYAFDKASTNFTDGEVLIKFKAGSVSTTYQAYVVLRGSGGSSTEDGYLIRLYEQNVQLGEMNSGSYSLFTAQTGGSITAGNYYWLRCRIEDTYLYARIWAESAAEPGTWTVSYDDTSGTRAAGWVGIGTYDADTDFDFVSVAYGDDPAPMIVEQDFTNLGSVTDEFTEVFNTANQTWTTTTTDARFGTTSLSGSLSTASGYYTMSWDLIPPAENDFEMLTLVRSNVASGRNIMIAARMSGTEGVDDQTYYLMIGSGWSGNGLVRHTQAGGEVSVDTGADIYYADNDYWLRFRIEGSNLYGKLWHITETEPNGWLWSGTDSTYSSGAKGHGIGIYDYADDPYLFHYMAASIGDGPGPQVPQLPHDTRYNWAYAKQYMGMQAFFEHSSGNSIVNYCRAIPLIVDDYGLYAAGILFASQENIDNTGMPRFALYIGGDADNDMSNAILVEDFGVPTGGMIDNCSLVPLYFSDGPKYFPPRTRLWIVAKSNSNAYYMGYRGLNSYPKARGHMPSNECYTYTTALGNDQTSAYASTLGSITYDTVTTGYVLQMAMIYADGTHYKKIFYRNDFSSYTTDDPLPTTAEWDTVADTHSSKDIRASSTEVLGGKYLELDYGNQFGVGGVALTKLWSENNLPMFQDRTLWQSALARVRISNVEAMICLRAKYYTETAYGWTFNINKTNSLIEIAEQHQYAHNVKASQSFTVDSTQWYWMKVSSNYESHKMKAWSGKIYEEPTAWDLTYTSTTEDVTPGIVGLQSYEDYAFFDVDYLSIGYNSDSLAIFEDNFDTADLAELNARDGWTHDANSTITPIDIGIYSNKGRVWNDAAGIARYPTIFADQTLSGDFTVVVDLDIQSVGTVDLNGIYLRVGNGGSIGSLPSEYLQIGAGYHSSANAWAWRERTGGSSGSWNTTSRTNSTGQVAISRSGSDIYLRYKDGSGDWTLAAKYTSKWTTTTTFVLAPYVDAETTNDIDLRFDNFKVYDFTDVAWAGTATTSTSIKADSTTLRMWGIVESATYTDDLEVYFEYGTTEAYGSTTTPATKTSIGLFYADATVSSGQAYNYRAVMRSKEDTSKTAVGANQVSSISGGFSMDMETVDELVALDCETTAGWTVTLGAINTKNANPFPYEGNYYLYGYDQLESKAEQTIDLVGLGIPTALIDNGDFEITVTWQQASYAADDQAEIQTRFENSSNGEISTYSPGLESTSPSQTWEERTYTRAIPANTRYIDVILHFYRTAGTNCDGYIDDIVITIDSATTTGGGGYRPAVIIVC